MERTYSQLTSPIGALLVAANEAGALTDLHFIDGKYVPAITGEWREEPSRPIFAAVQRELNEYFARARRTFSIPLAPQGTAFQCAAWHALRTIPHGQTRSYGEQARIMGKPKAVRAVGAANGRNPIAIIIPCHRVVGSNGSLTGYASGLDRKQFLLSLEM